MLEQIGLAKVESGVVEPAAQLGPLSEQRRVRDLHDRARGALGQITADIAQEEAYFDQPFERRLRCARDLVPAGEAAAPLARLRIDGREPGDEPAAELAVERGWIRRDRGRPMRLRKRNADGGFDRAVQSSTPFVFLEPQVAVGCVLVVEPLENEPEQWQGIGAASILEQLLRELRLDAEPTARSRLAGEPADVLITPLLPDFATMDYHRAEEAIQEGRAAVDRMGPLLKQVLG